MSASAAQSYFDQLVTWACAELTGDEVLLAHLTGEDSDFCRFNHASVRQAGSVRQREISIDLIDGARHAEGSVTIAENFDTDKPRVAALMASLREQRAVMPEDPHLLYETGGIDSERVVSGSLPAPTDAVDGVISGAGQLDLVGIYAAGEMFSGFANSLGQRNWFAASTFNLDWSIHHHADKATKNLYAGAEWSDDALKTKLDWSIRELEALARPARKLRPGRYRAFLAPPAMREIMGMLAWGGFGLKSHRTKQTPLLRMVTDGASLHDSVRISEDVARGVAPDFQRAGFARPDEITLIDGGKYVGHLISPRSAKEYDVEANGAEDHESPMAVSMGVGDLPSADALNELGTGLYVGNLWYLNFSDRAACRTTGMTRFGTFWVEGGEIVAPVDVLRFDDTAYHLLGDRLIGLTDTSEMMLDAATYGCRSAESMRLPGALVEEMTFTL